MRSDLTAGDAAEAGDVDTNAALDAIDARTRLEEQALLGNAEESDTSADDAEDINPDDPLLPDVPPAPAYAPRPRMSPPRPVLPRSMDGVRACFIEMLLVLIRFHVIAASSSLVHAACVQPAQVRVASCTNGQPKRQCES